MAFNFDRFVEELIRESAYDLRYTRERRPYAALPNGFGNKEPGIRLHFMPYGNQVKVAGVIDNAKYVGVKWPSIMVSMNAKPSQAVEMIRTRLIPIYMEAWYAAQPKITEWFNLQGEKEQATEELRRVLNLYQHFDLEKGVEVLTGKNIELILNNDLTVAMKMVVPRELASEILHTIRRSREQNRPDVIECPSCGGEGLVNGMSCRTCSGVGVILRRAAELHFKWQADGRDDEPAP